MPIYEYNCKSGHRYEELTSRFDATRSTCPACGTEAERVMSAPAPTPGTNGGAARAADFGGCGAEACMTGGCQSLKN
jgi:putative FmdB family regulatory protein